METGNKARREAAVLFFVVFLLGVICGGVGMHLWGARVWGGQPSPAVITRQQIIAETTRQLQLTPDQQQKLAAIMQNTHDRWVALYSPLDPQKEQIRQEGREQIRAMLTPEQRAKFDAAMQQVDAQRKKEAAGR